MKNYPACNELILHEFMEQLYSKTCLKRPLKKKIKIWFSKPIIAFAEILQNAPREHSAILSTFIKLPFAIKTFVLSVFEWPLKTGFTVILGPDLIFIVY